MTERMRTAACGLVTMAVAVALVLVLAPLTAAGQTTDGVDDAPNLVGCTGPAWPVGLPHADTIAATRSDERQGVPLG